MSYTDAEFQAAAERMRALYGENKVITDGNYDRSLAAAESSPISTRRSPPCR